MNDSQSLIDDICSAFTITPTAFWVQIFLLLFLTATLGVVARRVIEKVRDLESIPEWVRMLCDSFHTPSAWLIWGYGAIFTIESITEVTQFFDMAGILSKGRNVLFVSFAAWILLSWKGKYEKVLYRRAAKAESKAQDRLLIRAIGRVLSILIFVVAGLFILDILGVQLTALLTFGGIGGVAVGFAGKDIVANFFGGFMIHMIRHFSVGEWIMSPNKNFEGTVEEIGWYMTKIRTFARRPLFIPNALFMDAIIENPGRMYNRRIKETIGIRYADMESMDAIVSDIRKMLRTHKDIDQDKTLLVHFLTFGPYSLDIEVYCFTITTDWEEWRDIQQGVFLEIGKIVAKHGAKIAIPASTVLLEKGS